jgi:hypothetical protein
MSSLITARLYESDWVTPHLGIIPKLTAILQEDKSTILSSVDMEEVGNGWYQYEFTAYDNSKLYLFSIDWEWFDEINQFDSYGNKGTRWKRQELIMDPYAISEAVWDTKTKWHNKKWTFWELVQTPISYSEIIVGIDWLAKKIKEMIDWIKIPQSKQITKQQIIEWVEWVIEDKLKIWVKDALDEYENKEERWSTYNDEDVLVGIQNILESYNQLQSWLQELNNTVEWISKQDLIERLKKMDIEKTVQSIEDATQKRDTINTKHEQEAFEINKFNDNLTELKFMIKNLFTRLSIK